MCAECHSTNLQKNYDATKHEYRTTWSEINVCCEACHGPGSAHIDWARAQIPLLNKGETTKGLAIILDERKNVRRLPDPQTGNARRSAARSTETEMQLCARCHSRRALSPEETRYSYVYAVALHGAGREREALGKIDAALKRALEDRALSELREQWSKAK